MKKITLLGLLIGFVFTANAQTTQNANSNDMAQGYQKGLEAAAEGAKNQQLWTKGEGNPRMAQAYQEGLKPIGEEIKN